MVLSFSAILSFCIKCTVYVHFIQKLFCRVALSLASTTSRAMPFYKSSRNVPIQFSFASAPPAPGMGEWMIYSLYKTYAYKQTDKLREESFFNLCKYNKLKR